jgi:hypothetical protein
MFLNSATSYVVPCQVLTILLGHRSYAGSKVTLRLIALQGYHNFGCGDRDTPSADRVTSAHADLDEVHRKRPSLSTSPWRYNKQACAASPTMHHK